MYLVEDDRYIANILKKFIFFFFSLVAWFFGTLSLLSNGAKLKFDVKFSFVIL